MYFLDHYTEANSEVATSIITSLHKTNTPVTISEMPDTMTINHKVPGITTTQFCLLKLYEDFARDYSIATFN